MPKQYSITEARNRFSSLVRDVKDESVIEITHFGKPVAVLASIQEYNRLSDRKSSFWEALTAFRNRVNLQELNIEPDIFAGLRARSSEYEVDLQNLL